MIVGALDIVLNLYRHLQDDIQTVAKLLHTYRTNSFVDGLLDNNRIPNYNVFDKQSLTST